ncbi:MAG: hypothetical protein ACOVOC_11510, partial [Rhabdaerophilum sp.]
FEMLSEGRYVKVTRGKGRNGKMTTGKPALRENAEQGSRRNAFAKPDMSKPSGRRNRRGWVED